jgi:hypothetical protein
MRKERPLSDKELNAFKKVLSKLDKDRDINNLYLFGWVILVFFDYILFHSTYNEFITIRFILMMVSIYLSYSVIGFLSNLFERWQFRKSIGFVLKNNKVQSIKVISTEYYQLSEDRGEGVFYLFQLPNNKILSFGGDDFYPTNKLPSDNFEIAICYGLHKEILLEEIYNYGQKLEPILEITGEKKWDLLENDNYPDTDTYVIIDGRLEDFQTLFK